MVTHLNKHRTAYMVLLAIALAITSNVTDVLSYAFVSMALFMLLLVDYVLRYRIWMWPKEALIIIVAGVLALVYALFDAERVLYVLPVLSFGLGLDMLSKRLRATTQKK